MAQKIGLEPRDLPPSLSSLLPGFTPQSVPALTCPSPPLPVEGSHWNEGLLLGRPPEEPEQPLTENSLLEVLDGAVMMYNLSVHQQLGKVSVGPRVWHAVLHVGCMCVRVPACPHAPGLQGCLCHSKADACPCFRPDLGDGAGACRAGSP